MIVKFRKNNRHERPIDPDEIFLDSKNLENFDRQQFEGKIEKPISQKSIIAVGIFFVLLTLIFSSRLGYLQVKNGEAYRKRGENNILEKINIFAERGLIYDRNMTELAWNKSTRDMEAFNNQDETDDAPTAPTRVYLSPGFSHLLGYVSYPAKDASGRYWQSEFVGKDGLEKEYNDQIKGVNGSKIIETNALGEIHSENIIDAPKRGNALVATIDSRLQKEIFNSIKDLSENNSFTGGAGVMMDVSNGEIIASTSFPEYDSETLSLGKDKDKINTYITDKRKFFLDRTLSGLYTPGSIVKPFFALGALAEGIIDSTKPILSTGSISIQNPYDKTQKTVFNDWKAHGWTDMGQAIAVSSDVYFYTIGGGYGDQKGLGIVNLEKYAKMFKIGEATSVDLPDEKGGTIPSPEWKAKNFKGDPWRIGDTYHTAIGQYGFQVTPIEMVRATAALANEGTLVSPHFILGDKNAEKNVEQVQIEKGYYEVIHDGMRQAVTYGTAVGLNVPYVDVAAKTGTAQVGINKNKVNSWVIGFFPYEKPRYAFTVMMESGPTTNSVSATTVMRTLLDWMSIYTPEYFQS